jgi:hypothetical protein
MDKILEFGKVYFRPTDTGITLVDLHPDSPKPRIGIGPTNNQKLQIGAKWEQLKSTIPWRIHYLEDVRARQKSTADENILEARIIRHSQLNKLSMPANFPENLRLIHSQWHLVTGQVTDLIAVNINTNELTLIELKTQASFAPEAKSQLESYMALFRNRSKELIPFFKEVAQVMGTLYDCKELANLKKAFLGQIGVIAWPNFEGKVGVEMVISHK